MSRENVELVRRFFELFATVMATRWLRWPTRTVSCDRPLAVGRPARSNRGVPGIAPILRRSGGGRGALRSGRGRVHRPRRVASSRWVDSCGASRVLRIGVGIQKTTAKAAHGCGQAVLGRIGGRNDRCAIAPKPFARRVRGTEHRCALPEGPGCRVKRLARGTDGQRRLDHTAWPRARRSGVLAPRMQDGRAILALEATRAENS
jgi:hypothetical protein